MRIKQFLIDHWIALSLALLVGAVSVAPQIYVLSDNHYQGIQMFGTDAEYFYIGQVNLARYENYSQGPFPTDPGKNYYTNPKLDKRAMAALATILHLSVVALNVVLKFIGPALLFLLMYFFLLELFSISSVARMGPLLVLLGINLFNPTDLLRLGSLTTSIDSFLPYTRPFSPLVSSLFLFLCLWGIYRLVVGTLSLPKSIGLGILIGLTLYQYIYSWTFLVVVLGLYGLYFLVKRDREKIKLFFLTGFVSAVTVMPFFINLLKARADLDYVYTTARNGLIHTHLPIFGIWVLCGLLASLFLWPKKHDTTKIFFLVLCASLAVVLNQQVITGLKIQPGHYHWFYVKPLIVILISFLTLSFMERKVANKKLKTVAYILLGTVCFINAIIIQTHSYASNYATYQKNQQYRPLFDFLNDHYRDKKNIWASSDLHVSYPDLSYLILAYTHHRAPMVLDIYSASQAHSRDMLFLEYRLQGIGEKDILAAMTKDKNNVETTLYGIYYRDLPGSNGFPEAELEKLALEYSEFAKIPLEQVLKQMNIDIILENKNSNNWNLEKLPFLSPVYADQGIYAYEINR